MATWTKEEDVRLRELYESHTRAEIGAMMGRSEASIRTRCNTLGLNGKHPARWSGSETERLIALYKSCEGRHVPLAAFAESIGRSKPNVSRKARELGLTQKAGRKDPSKTWPDGTYKTLRQYATTEESRRAIGEKMKERIQRLGHNRGALGMHHSEETKKRLSDMTRQYQEGLTDEQREAMYVRRNQTNIARYGTANPAIRGCNQPFSRCKGGKRADLGNTYYRSGWEANYARYLNFLKSKGNVRDWQYEPKTFVFPGVTRGAITYTPDFLITKPDGSQEWHEVKGWMTGESKTRLKRMAKHFPEEKVIVIGEAEYKAIAKWKGLIEGWE